MAKPFKPCAAAGCNKSSHYTSGASSGFCRAHYARLRRHGDPTAGTTGRGVVQQWLRDHVSFDGQECLKWPFATSNKGYGVSTLSGKFIHAHRHMCLLAHGEAPPNQPIVAHICGKGHEGCVNPNHLRWASASENHQDAVKHGTHSGLRYKGSKHFNAVIDENDARAIKLLLKQGLSVSDIAQKTKITQHIVRSIKYGANWGHV